MIEETKKPECDLCGRTEYKWGIMSTITGKNYCNVCADNFILTLDKKRAKKYTEGLKCHGENG